MVSHPRVMGLLWRRSLGLSIESAMVWIPLASSILEMGVCPNVRLYRLMMIGGMVTSVLDRRSISVNTLPMVESTLPLAFRGRVRQTCRDL